MGKSYVALNLMDNGGRRLGIERRQFSYCRHLPERREAKDRRNSLDRRIGIDRRSGIDCRSVIDSRDGEEQAGAIEIWSYRELKRIAGRRSGAERRGFMVI